MMCRAAILRSGLFAVCVVASLTGGDHAYGQTQAGQTHGAPSLAKPLPALEGVMMPRPQSKPGETATMQPCPEYGAGFVRMPGALVCVRIGGQLRAEVIRR
ncbi:MAG: hypothetical protein ACRCWO_09710 [Bosea sp. (in: a-proteobacteria)]